jgi:bidirectional [NiFe] hydrogenase diaphorase subunit
MKKVSLTVNGKKIITGESENLLLTVLDNGIYIPNLCWLKEDEKPEASCRLCFVEIEGYNKPVPACTETVRDGMVVNTQGKKALRLVKTGFELLMASHTVDCVHCLANGSCELQKIAGYLKIKIDTKRFPKILRNLPVDESHPDFIYDPNKCVLCSKCVRVCRRNGTGVLGFAHRGFSRIVSTFGGMPLGKSDCRKCGECVNVCPTGALASRNADRGQFG